MLVGIFVCIFFFCVWDVKLILSAIKLYCILSGGCYQTYEKVVKMCVKVKQYQTIGVIQKN